MITLLLAQLKRWLSDFSQWLRFDGKNRFRLLLVSFNALLIIILAFSARNIEVRRNIRTIEEQIRHTIQRLATLQVEQMHYVYITATPRSAVAVVAGAGTINVDVATAATATSPPTATPNSTSTSTLGPTLVPVSTATPTAATSTPPQTPTATQTSIPLTSTSTPTQTPTATTLVIPTSTPTQPPTSAPTQTSTSAPTQTPTSTPSQTPTSTPTQTPTSTPTQTPTSTPVPLPTATLTPTLAPPTPTSTPPGEPDTIQLTASQMEIEANGSSTSVLQAQVYDQYGALVSDGTQVSFTTDRGSFSGSANVIALTSNGVAEAELTSSTEAGVATVYATAGKASSSIAIVFVAGPAHKLSLSAEPNQLTVGGTTTLRAAATDRFGNSIKDGTKIKFTTDLGSLSSASAETQVGIASVTLTSDIAGTATIEASSKSASSVIAVYWMPAVEVTMQVDRSQASSGSIVVYTVVIHNASAGGDNALVGALTGRLPSDFSYVPGSTVSAAFTVEPTIQGQDLVWTTAPSPYDLAAGATVVASFEARVGPTSGTHPSEAVVDGQNFGSSSTGETAHVTVQGLIVSLMQPNSGFNDAPVDATVEGAGFALGAAAQLGAWVLDTTWVSEQRLQVQVPAHIAATTYDLMVTNPASSSVTLPNAYQALNRPLAGTTLDSGFLGTYGAEPFFSPSQGDDDQVQVLFLEVPDGSPGPLYVRLFDPDCGDTLDVQNGFNWDTPFTFALYGGTGAYTAADARSAHPTTGATSGTILATAVFTEDSSIDGRWLNLGQVDVSAGEPVGGKRIFKLTVIGGPEPPFMGGSRADLNVYNVALSTSPSSNSAPDGARIFAFSWTFLIPAATYHTPPRMFPYMPANASSFTQNNWDYDNDAFGTGQAGMIIKTPIRTIAIPDDGISGSNELRSSDHPVLAEEHNTTWAVTCWAEPTGQLQDNLVTFWASDQNGTPLALFARTTAAPPP